MHRPRRSGHRSSQRESATGVAQTSGHRRPKHEQTWRSTAGRVVPSVGVVAQRKWAMDSDQSHHFRQPAFYDSRERTACMAQGPSPRSRHKQRTCQLVSIASPRGVHGRRAGGNISSTLHGEVEQKWSSQLIRPAPSLFPPYFAERGACARVLTPTGEMLPPHACSGSRSAGTSPPD